MKTLSNIKKDLEFNSSLASLIEVLKNIAVAQYRILEHKLESYENLLVDIDNFCRFFDTQKVKHPFFDAGDRPLAVVAVTSDSGLLGGLNMQVVNQALAELEKRTGKIIVVGERGKAYVRESKVPFVSFPGIKDEERYTQAMELRDYLVRGALKGDFGYLKIVYPRPVSFTMQRVETFSFLPYLPAPDKASPAHQSVSEVIMESRPEDIIEYLVYIWIGQKIYDIFGLSRLAEFAARFVHLEASHQKLKDMDVKIRRDYFRVRHELIDRNMREIFASRSLYAG